MNLSHRLKRLEQRLGPPPPPITQQVESAAFASISMEELILLIERPERWSEVTPLRTHRLFRTSPGDLVRPTKLGPWK